MANRYAVLVTGNNNWSAITTWSSTADGLNPGASVPSASDNVFISSICQTGATLTIDAAANCLNMDWTGATNTPTLSAPSSARLTVFGSAVFITDMSATFADRLTFSPAGAATLTTNGCVINGGVRLAGGGTNFITLLDNLNMGTGSYISNPGYFNVNGKTVTGSTFSPNNGGANWLTLGSGTINCTDWLYGGGTLTVDANTSTINCSGNFSGGGIATYNIVNLTGATSTISGSNTFAQLNLTPAVTQTITFTDGTTQTVTTSNLSGTAGHVHTLQGTSTAGWNITKAGGGTILANYATIQYSQSRPVNTFYARPPSTDKGGNTGWIFPNSTGNSVLEQALLAGLI